MARVHDPPIQLAAKDRAAANSAGIRRPRDPISARPTTGTTKAPANNLRGYLLAQAEDQAKLASCRERGHQVAPRRDRAGPHHGRAALEHDEDRQRLHQPRTRRSTAFADHRAPYQVVARDRTEPGVAARPNVGNCVRPVARADRDGRVGSHSESRARRGSHSQESHGDADSRLPRARPSRSWPTTTLPLSTLSVRGSRKASGTQASPLTWKLPA